jgi:asparagine synthase (glutamine-hydrolysing)
MCGIAGMMNIARDRSESELTSLVVGMTNTLHHRGPDDGDSWVDARAGIALGHRRLSILDLSAEGRQPTACACGRYVVVFNGEIYNFRELRAELEVAGDVFRGHSDTEVMISYICRYGVVEATRRFNGMFAFAVWDREERRLHLVRDRIGEKPLYYGWMGKTLLFGSELKALRSHPDFTPTIDRNALALFLRHNYVPSPYSIYSGVHKLQPGTILSISSRGAAQYHAVSAQYWSMKKVAERGVAEPFVGTMSEAIRQVDGLLRDAVKLRMEADVPLGAFLSGGIDSSTIVALMQAQSMQPIQTFTIGFYETEYNEAIHARAIAEHLGTDHHELYVTAQDALAVIPRLPDLYDEPFSDPSQIPTYLVSSLARRSVTVTLSGDAGDELFGGYDRYMLCAKIWKALRWLPLYPRRAMARLLTAVPPEGWNRLIRNPALALSRVRHASNPGEQLHKLAEVLAIPTVHELYRHLMSHWKRPADLVSGASEPPTVLTDTARRPRLRTLHDDMMYLDMESYLPDDILVKVDRASMAVSLEARIPLLDHRLIEFAWRLPGHMKIQKGTGKCLLRQVLHQYVPASLVERPKMGFGVPIDAWLRGPLRDWGEAFLDERRLREEGYLNPAPIRQKWIEHQSGARNWQYYLWDVLMFQAWLSESKC